MALLLVLFRPRQLSEAIPALAGAALFVLVGAVSPRHAGQALLSHWNLFLFFLGLMTIAAVADTAGVFDWLAQKAALLSRGSRRRLLLNVFVLGTVMTAFLSNDATTLILTPIVFTLATRFGLPPRPYVFSCAFVANTASFLLPVSNPINVLLLDRFPIPLSSYFVHLLPVSVLAIAINLVVFLILFRREVRGNFRLARMDDVAAGKARPIFFRLVCAWLLATAGIYVLAAARQWPVGLVAAMSGTGLIAAAWLAGTLSWHNLAKEISWSLFGFVAGMLILVQGLEDAGITKALARLLELGGHSASGVAIASVATAAVGANVINNLPASLVLESAIGHTGAGSQTTLLAFGTLVGADLGPNLTVVGSLSTMLWLLILRRRDLEVSALEYLRVGAMVTPIMLLCSAAVLWLTSR